MKGFKTAAILAMKDITLYQKQSNESVNGFSSEVWIVTPSTLYTPENRLLNRKLGLRNINNFGNKNGLTIK